MVGFTPTDSVTVEYIKWCFDCLRVDIERRAPAGAQKNINLDFLRKLRIPVPPKELQIAFSSRVNAAREALFEPDQQRESASSKFTALRASLLARAFTGELTAEWRQRHETTLRAEARDRDEALRAAGVPLGQRATIQEIDAILRPPGPDDSRYAELTAEQLTIVRTLERLSYDQLKPLLFDLETLGDWLAGESSAQDELASALGASPEMLRAPLDVLAARGLLQRYQRQRGKGDFATLYRLPWLEGEDGQWTQDDVRAEELERLAAPRADFPGPA